MGVTGDHELLRQHLAGDQMALHTLVGRYEKQLHWAERVAGVEEKDIPDVHQDVILRIHDRAGGFRFESSVMTWMVSIAHRTAQNHLKIQRRKPTGGANAGLDVNDCERELHRGAGPDGQADGALGGGVGRTNVDLSVDLHTALNSIPVVFRQTVVLRGLWGYTIPEISRMLNVAPGTVKSRYSRGRLLLQSSDSLQGYAA